MSAADPPHVASTTSRSGRTQREPLATFLCDHLGMHVIEQTDTFTLVGVDAKLGKLTLFDAEGPRERGALERIVLRVGDLDAALAGLPGRRGRRPTDGVARFEAPGRRAAGAGRARRRSTSTSTTSCCACPTATPRWRSCEAMGFERRDGGLAVADRELRVVEADARRGRAPAAQPHRAAGGLRRRGAARRRGARRRGRRRQGRPQHVRGLPARARRRPHRVRRAQAGLLAGLSGWRTWSSPAPAWPASWRPPRRAACGAAAGRAREGRPPRRLDAAVERRGLAPPRASSASAPSARAATERCSGSCSSGSTTDLRWLESLGAPVLERETGNPLTTGVRFDTERPDRGAGRGGRRRAPVRRRCASCPASRR